MGYVEGLLANNEQIVVKTRRHWIVLASSFLSNLLFLIIIVAIAGAAVVALGQLGFVVLVLLVFPVFMFGRTYINWMNEEYLVTNRRVIQAEGVVNKHVIDSSLEKVNDVVLNQSVLGRLLDYGDVEILTASEIGVNKLEKIAQPVKFKTEMLNQKEALGMDEHPAAGRARPHDDIPSMIAELDDLRKQGVLTEVEFQQKKQQLLAKM